MIPSGISLKQIPNYCHFTQRETWCDLTGSVDAVRQKSSIQLQAIALRSATLAKETSKASQDIHLSLPRLSPVIY